MSAQYTFESCTQYQELTLELKNCNKCTKDLPYTDFRVDNIKTGRLHNYCKLCQKEYLRDYYKAYYQDNKGQYVPRRLKSTREKHQKVFDYLLTHPCVDCGYSNPIALQFDHITGKKEFAISRAYRKSWELISKEISKCEVRCANCHIIKTSKQQNYQRADLLAKHITGFDSQS